MYKELERTFSVLTLRLPVQYIWFRLIVSLFPPTGIRVEFDLSKPPQHRVKSLSILCTKCRVPVYEPVENEMVYKVVLPSYMVTGGDGFSMIKDGFLKHNSGEGFVSFALGLMFFQRFFSHLFLLLPGDLDISVVSRYITQRKQVYPSVEGRIKLYNSAAGLEGQTASLIFMVSLVLLWSFRGNI